jgi:hypothetical protein
MRKPGYRGPRAQWLKDKFEGKQIKDKVAFFISC